MNQLSLRILFLFGKERWDYNILVLIFLCGFRNDSESSMKTCLRKNVMHPHKLSASLKHTHLRSYILIKNWPVPRLQNSLQHARDIDCAPTTWQPDVVLHWESKHDQYISKGL